MTFGNALKELQMGKLLARESWNGKNQFVFLISGQDLSSGLKYGYGEYEHEQKFTDVLAIKTSKNEIQVGWLATQSDMLANDWLEVKV